VESRATASRPQGLLGSFSSRSSLRPLLCKPALLRDDPHDFAKDAVRHEGFVCAHGRLELLAPIADLAYREVAGDAAIGVHSSG
jgi:hypothetical protein